MEPILVVWRQLRIAQRVAAIAIPIGLMALVACAAALSLTPKPVATVAVASPSPTRTPTSPPLPPEPTLAPSASPIPSPTPGPPTADPLLGTDGRLTALLLGSDYRPAHPGNRTDAIIVVSVDPTTGEAAGFSVPRDTSGFPLAKGARYGPKINALYASLQSRTGNGGLAMRQAFASAFNIEIDGYVFIGFSGVKRLVSAVGGVDVTLDKPYYDPYYWVSARRQGWGLKAGTSHLGPDDALIFARSRKGDNDFGRARRQQVLVLAALDKVRSRGVGSLPKLLAIAKDTVRTDLPLDRAEDLFRIVATTDISAVDRTVFGPTKYAQGTGGSSFQLRIDVCREWIAENFPPVRPMGQWPVEPAVPSRAEDGFEVGRSRPI
jgi:polyisoprenyl-teichoic acid--peptidoglycan teichoic acid transferase